MTFENVGLECDTDVVDLNARPPKWLSRVKYRRRFNLLPSLREAYTVALDESRHKKKWGKLMLSPRAVNVDTKSAHICKTCVRTLKRNKVPKFAIANGLYMGVGEDIPEYECLSEMEMMLLSTGGRTHTAIKTIYLESPDAPNGKWSLRRPNL